MKRLLLVLVLVLAILVFSIVVLGLVGCGNVIALPEAYEPPENGGYIGPNTPAYNPQPDTTPGSEPSCEPGSEMYCVKDGCVGYRVCTCNTPPPGSNTTAFCTWSVCITDCD